MSEYVDIQVEATGRPGEMRLVTNLDLAAGAAKEVYNSPEEGDEGSPLAQSLFAVPGLASLVIEGGDLIITRDDDVEWHDLIEDISDVLRDFFL